jgi:predicted AAA+ superfamily ATPase
LWGARGTGKSALVKAVHAAVAADHPALKIVEVASADLPGLSGVAGALADGGSRVILYVDDLSFDGDEAGLKALKPALDGGLAGRPGNVIVYATSNRRHLIARDPRENLATDLHWSDTAEDRLALSDRFGLSLGFHALDEEEYLAIVAAYAKRIGLPAPSQETEARARIWALDRGARSGRTAWQFIVAAAAEAGVALDF